MIMKRILTILALYLSFLTDMSAQTCPDSHHPHAIDLGIGVKFACCNVGARAPEKYGDYYSWGETKEKSIYDEDHYPGHGSQVWKNREYTDFGPDISGTMYDVAQAKWGGNWHIPTKEQMELLKDKCISEWTTYKRVKGRKFTGPNGNSIFLPATGSLWYSDLKSPNEFGGYWSSTASTTSSNGTKDAYQFNINESSAGISYSDRATGRPVRPVAE